MIRHIVGGPGIVVTNSGSYLPNFSQTTPSAGLVRYSGISQTLEVYDGYSWNQLTMSTPTVQLDSMTEQVISWAHKKWMEEQQLENLANTNPAIRIAFDAFKKAQDQLTTTIILSKNEETSS